LSVVQIKLFRPNSCHTATDSQSFLFSVKIFSRTFFASKFQKYFSPGSEPALGGPLSKFPENKFCFLGEHENDTMGLLSFSNKNSKF
jgi:hypothetical protein